MVSNLWVVPRAEGIRYMKFMSVLIFSPHGMCQRQNGKYHCSVTHGVRAVAPSPVLRATHHLD